MANFPDWKAPFVGTEVAFCRYLSLSVKLVISIRVTERWKSYKVLPKDKNIGRYFTEKYYSQNNPHSKSGTFARQTKANFAKESACCQRTGNTLRLDTDLYNR